MTPLTWLVLASALAADPPPLQADRPTVDLGSQPAHKSLVHTFQLKNTGATGLTITDVGGGCGCFRHKLGQRTLEPGQRTELTVTISLLAQPAGARSWDLAVRYASGETARDLPVRLTATVSRDVSVEPAALMLSAEGAITGTVTVIDRRPKPLTVTGARLGIKGVSAIVQPRKRAEGLVTQAIDVAVAADVPPDQYADELCLDTDDPTTPEIRVPLRVVKRAVGKGVQAFPGTASLRFAKGQETATTLLRLKDAADAQVTVGEASSDQAGIAVKWAAGPDRMVTVRVTVDRAKAPPSGIGVVTVKVTGPATETVLIPVSWGGPEAK
jgi:hypothetical protein